MIRRENRQGGGRKRERVSIYLHSLLEVRAMNIAKQRHRTITCGLCSHKLRITTTDTQTDQKWMEPQEQTKGLNK